MVVLYFCMCLQTLSSIDIVISENNVGISLGVTCVTQNSVSEMILLLHAAPDHRQIRQASSLVMVFWEV